MEDELAEVDRKRKDYEDMVAGESQNQGKDVHLEDAQVRLDTSNKRYVQIGSVEFCIALYYLWDRVFHTLNLIILIMSREEFCNLIESPNSMCKEKNDLNSDV